MTNRDAIKTLAVLREEINCSEEPHVLTDKQLYVNAINKAIETLGIEADSISKEEVAKKLDKRISEVNITTEKARGFVEGLIIAKGIALGVLESEGEQMELKI